MFPTVRCSFLNLRPDHIGYWGPFGQCAIPYFISLLNWNTFLFLICLSFFRRMFPTVRCSFLNLRPDQRYWVLLDIVPCDNKRYRYAYHRSSWLVAGKADPPPPHRLYTHPDSPFTGDQLRKQVVSFEKVKLTNNEMDKNGQVSLLLLFSSIYRLGQSYSFSKEIFCITVTRWTLWFDKLW